MLPEDVPGLTVLDGAAVAATEGLCFDQEHHAFIFNGDRAVEVVPGNEDTVTIRGTPFNATTIFNVNPSSANHCIDAPGAVHAWAVWRQR